MRRLLALALLTTMIAAAPVLAADRARWSPDSKSRSAAKKADLGPQRASWRTLLGYWLQSQKDKVKSGFADGQAFDELAKILACDYFTLYRNDEFEWPRRKALIQALLTASSPGPKFRVTALAPLGSYEAEKESFQFRPLAQAAINYTRTYDFREGIENTKCSGQTPFFIHSPWPTSFQIVIENADILNGVPMPTQEATEFLRNRNGPNGLERNVQMVLDMEVTRFDDRPYEDKTREQGLVQSRAYVRVLRAQINDQTLGRIGPLHIREYDPSTGTTRTVPIENEAMKGLLK